MSVLKTKINTVSPAYKANYEAMKLKVSELADWMKKSQFQGEEKYINRFKAKGKLLARERIEMLVDPDSPFLELMPLAGWGTDDFCLGGTLVAGLGYVSGRLCMITANVGTIKGGAIDYTTLQKSLRLSEISMENKIPTINLVESAGANLPDQAKIFNYGGASFREITRRSAQNIPTISVVFGNSTAGGAYIPGMSDYTILVKSQAKVFLAGPPLVKMATNEVTEEEALGGAEMHSRVSGVADYLAQDEADALRIAREIMAYIGKVNPNNNKYKEPNYDAEEILGVVTVDPRIPFDIKELIARIVDGSEFQEFKPDYGNTLACGFASVGGFKIGILGNNGVLFSDSANKGAQFIQRGNQNNTPLLFLQNITGFMVGKKYEEEGIIKHGAKMINTVSNSKVPAITIIVGASYGAGNYAMCGRAYKPRFLFTYPNAKIAVMGSDQLSGVMEIIAREAAVKGGYEYDVEQGKQMRQYMISEADKQNNAYFATGQVWDEGIIDPRETRNYLKFCLQIIYREEFVGTKEYGVFRM